MELLLNQATLDTLSANYSTLLRKIFHLTYCFLANYIFP